MKKKSDSCAACAEIGWVRFLKTKSGRFPAGTKLCRACYQEIITGKIVNQTLYQKDGRTVKRHSDTRITEDDLGFSSPATEATWRKMMD